MPAATDTHTKSPHVSKPVAAFAVAMLFLHPTQEIPTPYDPETHTVRARDANPSLDPPPPRGALPAIHLRPHKDPHP